MRERCSYGFGGFVLVLVYLRTSLSAGPARRRPGQRPPPAHAKHGRRHRGEHGALPKRAPLRRLERAPPPAPQRRRRPPSHPRREDQADRRPVGHPPPRRPSDDARHPRRRGEVLPNHHFSNFKIFKLIFKLFYVSIYAIGIFMKTNPIKVLPYFRCYSPNRLKVHYNISISMSISAYSPYKVIW